MANPSKMEWACGFLNQQLLGGKIEDYGKECGIRTLGVEKFCQSVVKRAADEQYSNND